MAELKYMLEGYTCTGEPPNINCTVTRKTILPDSIAEVLDQYIKNRGFEDILFKSEALTNDLTYQFAHGSTVDWTQWFDKARLEKLLAFSEGYGYGGAAEEIKKLLSL